MAQPSKPVVVQLRPSELVLLWQPGSDTAGAEGYCVELRHSLHDGVNHGTFGSWKVAVPNTWSLHPACHLRDLHPESCYEFRVAAVNGTSGVSPTSDPILMPADTGGHPAAVATAAPPPGQRRPTASLSARESRREQPSEPAALSRRAAGPSTARARRRSPSPEQGKTSRSTTGLPEGQNPRARRSRATKPSGAAPAQERGKGEGRRKAGGRQPRARASGGHSGGGGGGGGGFAAQALAATAGERFAVQALKRRASRRASAADGGAPLVAGLARAPLPSEASYLLTLLEASNQGESRDGLTLPHTLEQLGDASLQAALDAFTAADAFRTGRLVRRDYCGMLGALYAAAGAAPLSPKEATQLFEQADLHRKGYVCFHEARHLVIVISPRDTCAFARCCTPGRATPTPTPAPTPSLTPTTNPAQVLHAWPRIQAVCDAARVDQAEHIAAAAPASPGARSFEEVASGVAVGDELGRLQLRRALSELSDLLPGEAALAEPRGAATVHALLQSVGPDILTQLAQACSQPRVSASAATLGVRHVVEAVTLGVEAATQVLQPPCTEAASCNPTCPQAFASHAPEADGRLRGSSLLGLAASLAQGQVGGGLGLVSREELERVLLLPSAGAEPEREGAVSLEGWVGDGEGGAGAVSPGGAEREGWAELGGAAGAAARGILQAAAMRQGVSFLEAAARLARLLRRQGPDGKRLSWERYCALLLHVSAQAGHSIPAQASEAEPDPDPDPDPDPNPNPSPNPSPDPNPHCADERGGAAGECGPLPHLRRPRARRAGPAPVPQAHGPARRAERLDTLGHPGEA